MSIRLLNLLQRVILGIFLTTAFPNNILANLQAPEFKKIVCEVTINKKENKILYLEIADTEKKRSYG
ncbi:hypothetical protein OAI86_05550, partial [Alphaproteobacteria bacterium]|nr:hypothetical protein [Alphaproteobacteria bacterium]